VNRELARGNSAKVLHIPKRAFKRSLMGSDAPKGKQRESLERKSQLESVCPVAELQLRALTRLFACEKSGSKVSLPKAACENRSTSLYDVNTRCLLSKHSRLFRCRSRCSCKSINRRDSWRRCERTRAAFINHPNELNSPCPGCSVVNANCGALSEIHMNKHKPERSGVHVDQNVAMMQQIKRRSSVYSTMRKSFRRFNYANR
jgi:hypothetical protein